MNAPEFKDMVSEWLGQQVYARIPKKISYQPEGKSSKKPQQPDG